MNIHLFIHARLMSVLYIGGLHFANIEMEDERAGLHYVCVVDNTVLRNLVQGDDQVIRPHFVEGELRLLQQMN